jgi:transcriptional regulator with XRE-family HTH domain
MAGDASFISQAIRGAWNTILDYNRKPSIQQFRIIVTTDIADVAERTRIDKAALSRLENGQHVNPTVKTLARYARALGKSLTWGLAEETDR